MNLITSIVLALGLCFDSFAVSLSNGMKQCKVEKMHFFRFSLILAFFQGSMPLLGWAVAARFQHHIAQFDHWVAFVLLALLGVKMIRESQSKKNGEKTESFCFELKDTLLLGVATSIDALITGAALAMLTIQVLPEAPQFGNMLVVSGIVFLATFAACVTGIFLGRRVGNKTGKYAEMAGGIILIAIGAKVLFEHLCGAG